MSTSPPPVDPGTTTPTRRPRNTTRQREAGAAARQETRRRLVHAAAQLFAERGYAGSTVTAIAERAGVSLQTLYLAWGSKRELLRAYAEDALSGSPTSITDHTWVDQVRATVQQQLPPDADPATRLRTAAHVFRQVAERAELAWKLYRDAAASDLEIAKDQAELRKLRRKTMAATFTDNLDQSAFRPGLTKEDALDTVMVVASPESYDVLVRYGTYTTDQFEEWIARTLTAALLADPPA